MLAVGRNLYIARFIFCFYRRKLSVYFPVASVAVGSTRSKHHRNQSVDSQSHMLNASAWPLSKSWLCVALWPLFVRCTAS